MKMQRKWLGRGAVVLLLCLMAAGCGQKGPLYFPKDKPAAAQPSQQN